MHQQHRVSNRTNNVTDGNVRGQGRHTSPRRSATVCRLNRSSSDAQRSRNCNSSMKTNTGVRVLRCSATRSATQDADGYRLFHVDGLVQKVMQNSAGATDVYSEEAEAAAHDEVNLMLSLLGIDETFEMSVAVSQLLHLGSGGLCGNRRMQLVYAANRTPTNFATRLVELRCLNRGSDIAELVLKSPELILSDARISPEIDFTTLLVEACHTLFPKIPFKSIEGYVVHHIRSLSNFDLIVPYPRWSYSWGIDTPKNRAIVATQFAHVVQQARVWLHAREGRLVDNTEAFDWLQTQPDEFTLLCSRDLWGDSVWGEGSEAQAGYMKVHTNWTDKPSDDWVQRLADWRLELKDWEMFVED